MYYFQDNNYLISYIVMFAFLWYLFKFPNFTQVHLFGPKRDANGKWRRLHNEELHSQSDAGRLRWAGHVARMEEGRSAFKNVTDRPTGKRF